MTSIARRSFPFLEDSSCGRTSYAWLRVVEVLHRGDQGVVLRSDRRWIVAFGERDHYVRFPSLACGDELVEFGNEWIAVRGAKAWDGGVV